MPIGILEQIVAGDAPPLVPLTTDQYHRLIETGVLPEGAAIELIDGFLVHKDRADSGSSSPMNQGPIHAQVVRRLMQSVSLQIEAAASGALTQCQLPIQLSPHHEPEPDVSIIEGPDSNYTRLLPTSAATLAVIEVAHSSLSFDRGKKQQIYAAADIPLFVVVDLVNNVIELYSNPDADESRYSKCLTFSSRDTVTLELRDGTRVLLNAADLLPIQ